MALKVYQNMRTLGIRSQNVYRLEKKGGAPTEANVREEMNATQAEDPLDMSEFYEICKQASGRHTKWRKNNFLLWYDHNLTLQLSFLSTKILN